MKLLAAALVSLVATTAAADITIMENRKTITVDCAKDPEVNLVGNHIRVTLVGTCKKVTVTGNHESVVGSVISARVLGNHNTLDLDGVDALSIAGNHNTASYKRPLEAKKTAVSNVGKYNTVKKK